MDQGVWQFSRGAEQLQISRQALDDGMALIVGSGSTPRSYFFSDAARLETFQSDMETLLLKTGWSLVAFAPNRRQGNDRRGFPRRADDRRRWWTDGTDVSLPAIRKAPVKASLREPDSKQRSSNDKP